MRFFLGAHGPGFALIGIIEARFLLYLAPGFDNRDLAAGLNLDGLLDEPHGVHVLDFASRPKVAEILRLLVFLILTGQTDRHVDIGAHCARLHVAIAGAQIA